MLYGTIHFKIFALMAIMLVALVGCSGADHHQPQASAEVAAGIPTGDQLPALPLGEPARVASGTELIAETGSDFHERTAHNTTINGLNLELHPGPGEIAWATYGFKVSGFEYGEINILATVNNPDKVWYGLADYSSGSWQLFPASEVGTTLEPLAGENRSTLGNGFLVVVAYDETFVSFDRFFTEIEVPDWQSHAIYNGNLDGWISDMELINDRLYLAYQRFEIHETILARAMVPEPFVKDDWDISLAISNMNAIDLDLEDVDGVPAMTLIDFPDMQITYAFADGLEPKDINDWSGYEISNVDDLASEEQPQDLAEIDGRPAVIYVKPDGADNAVWYGIGDFPQPPDESSWTHHKLGSFGPLFPYQSGVSMAESLSKPVVAFHSNYMDRMYYAMGESASPADSGSWLKYTLDRFGGSGEPTRILTVNDVPYVAKRDSETDQLYFYSAGSSDPAEPGEWHACLVANDVGPQFDAEARPGGGFAIAWRDVHGNIYYAETDLDQPRYARDWRVAEARFNVGTDGDVSLEIAQTGRPYISFLVSNEFDEELRVQRMAGLT